LLRVGVEIDSRSSCTRWFRIIGQRYVTKSRCRRQLGG
jgi:hypothetical protein